MATAAGDSSGDSSVVVITSILVWMSLSTALIFFNAIILHDFHHPIALGVWHMAVCSGLALVGRLLCPSAFQTGDPEAGIEPLTIRTALRLGVPVAVMQAMGMALGNIAYMLLSVSFVQMVKAWTSACVYLVGVTMGVQTWSVAVAKTIAVITLGLTLASLGELNFNLYGFLAQLLSLLAEGFRINLLETRLKSNGYRLNPLSSLMVFAPIIMVFMSVMCLLLEPNGLSMRQIDLVGREVLVANALLAFFLNISAYFVIQLASGLAFALSGVVKDILIILGSVIVFDTTLTGTQMLGYSIAVGGLQAYTVVSKAPEDFDGGVAPELWRRLFALGTLAPPKAASAAVSDEQATEMPLQGDPVGSPRGSPSGSRAGTPNSAQVPLRDLPVSVVPGMGERRSSSKNSAKKDQAKPRQNTGPAPSAAVVGKCHTDAGGDTQPTPTAVDAPAIPGLLNFDLSAERR